MMTKASARKIPRKKQYQHKQKSISTYCKANKENMFPMNWEEKIGIRKNMASTSQSEKL